MNRRNLIHGMGFCGLMAASQGLLDSPIKRIVPLHPGIAAKTALPMKVAGVRLIDSDIAGKATQLARDCSPPYLFNHAVRTFLFASLTGRSLKRKYDEELLFLACILHDLGLTDRFQGDLPFEIQGAEAAKDFLLSQSYPEAKTDTIWDGIAMHASPIAQFKRPEIALVAEGAGADVLGADAAQIGTNETEQIVKAFPRLGFKSNFVRTCAEVVKKHPRGASRGFMRDVGERYVADFHPRNFCDLLAQAPYSD